MVDASGAAIRGDSERGNAVPAPRDGTYSSVRVLWSRRAAASLVGHMMLATQLAGSRWTPLEERFLRR